MSKQKKIVYRTCTEFLIDARISASDKDLPVIYPFFDRDPERSWKLLFFQLLPLFSHLLFIYYLDEIQYFSFSITIRFPSI